MARGDQVGGALAAQYIRFGAWASSCRRPVTAARIRREFNVSRATAYRWLAALKDALPSVRVAPDNDEEFEGSASDAHCPFNLDALRGFRQWHLLTRGQPVTAWHT